MVPRPLQLVTGLAALCAVLLGCGSEPSVEDAAIVETSVAGEDMAEPAAEPPPDLALVDEEEDSLADPGPFTGDPDSPWCDEARLAGSELLSMDIFGLTPAEMEDRFQTSAAVFGRMRAAAPPELSDDMRSISEVFELFIQLGHDTGWDLDLMLADPRLMSVLDISALESGLSAIDRYNLEVCGVQSLP
ncbi:MAG: hypothetical protein AAF531_08355 [Actinomycetota bacterium]